MMPDWIHRDFTWNNRTFSSASDLIEFVSQNCPEAIDFIQSWLGVKGEIRVRTSGSTGMPKEIVLNRDRMMASARATGDYFGLGVGSRALLCLPLEYIAGKMMLVRAMTLGWNLSSSFPVTEIHQSKDERFDFAAMVPMQLSRHHKMIENLRMLLLGGGEVSGDTQELIADSPCKVYLGYGMTETITHVAVKPLNKAAGRTGSEDHFNALPGILFRTDSRNCLVISAPRVSKDEIITNDLVELISKRSFKWLARYDNIINSGGIKLLPELIENKLRPLISGEFFAWGLRDETLGQRLVLVIEGDPYELLKVLKQFQMENPDLIKGYELPKETLFIPEMLRTETGKLRRKATIDKILRS